jgi:hypothetical protein
MPRSRRGNLGDSAADPARAPGPLAFESGIHTNSFGCAAVIDDPEQRKVPIRDGRFSRSTVSATDLLLNLLRTEFARFPTSGFRPSLGISFERSSQIARAALISSVAS